jgi:hypothetical protein
MNIKSALRLTATTLAALGLLAATTTALHAATIKQIAESTANAGWNNTALWEGDAAPAAGNDYFNDGYSLRTPTVTNLTPAVFAGDSLTMDTGTGTSSQLTLKSRVTTIADLRLGNVTISNSALTGSAANILATLNVTDLTIIQGKTATLTGNNSNQDINLNATTLRGSGTLSINSTPRTYTLAIVDATAFTGTISTLGGNATLVIASGLNLINGAFSVNTATSLVLDNNLVVPSFTFGSATLNTLGESYTAAQLNAHFGTTAFSGTGSLIVASTVPEPASVAVLLAAAAAMLAATLRRRL